MWDIKSLKEKQKYIEERLKNCTDNRERELLQLSLVSYSALLNNSGTFVHTQIPNIIDKLTQSQFKSKKEIEMGKLEYELFFGDEPYLDEQYLEFLMQLCNNVASTDLVEIEGLSLEPMEVIYENLINMSKSFYFQLGDNEIYEMAMKTLNDDTALNFSTITRRSMAECSGLTFNDYIFDKSYCTVTKKNNVFDYQVLNHEVMHGVDFYMQKKIPSENYYGFHEVPTYTIDYLFIDYLEKMGLSAEQVQLLRKQKDNYLQELAKITLMQIKRLLIQQKGYKASINPSIQDVLEILNPKIKKQLLEIQSGIMAVGLSEQIKNNNVEGLNNLKQFMKSIIPKEQTPDFSYIGLSAYELLQYSEQIGNYSMQNENNVSARGK